MHLEGFYMRKSRKHIMQKKSKSEKVYTSHTLFKEDDDLKVKNLREDVTHSQDKVYTLRIKQGLNTRFEQAADFENIPRSKILRYLIEFYIIRVEETMERNRNELRMILNEPDEKRQMDMVMQLPDDEKLQYLKLKQSALENKSIKTRKKQVK